MSEIARDLRSRGDSHHVRQPALRISGLAIREDRGGLALRV